MREYPAGAGGGGCSDNSDSDDGHGNLMFGQGVDLQAPPSEEIATSQAQSCTCVPAAHAIESKLHLGLGHGAAQAIQLIHLLKGVVHTLVDLGEGQQRYVHRPHPEITGVFAHTLRLILLRSILPVPVLDVGLLLKNRPLQFTAGQLLTSTA